MKSMMRKTMLREIWQSLGRYVAILAIVALGVGFFAGLKIIKPAMVDMANEYWMDKQLYDLRLLSTIGFEQDDVDVFAANDDVKVAQGAISTDILYLDEDSNEKVMKVHSITDSVNGIELLEGRMPETADECVVDSNLYNASQIGEKVVLSENNETDDLDMFLGKEYTIVGIVNASYYANFERGNTSLGNGRVSGFMYIPLSGFDCDYFTEIFIKFVQDLPIYSDAYDDYMDEKKDDWDEFCEQQVDARYQSIKGDAQQELEDARVELADKKAEAEEELTDAQVQLDDAKVQIEDGETELEKAEKELNSNEKKLNEQETLLLEQEAELNAQLEAMSGAAMAQIQAQMSLAQMEAARLQMENAKAQLEAGKAQLEEGKAQIEAGRTQIKDARATIAEKKQELDDAKVELADGQKEYDESYADFQTQISDAEKEIEDAQKEIDDLEEPDNYVLGRDTNTGYVCFKSDSQIIDQIANVLPLFFFMVAALVCMTTMNRMVEEQRTQIGVLKALGYGEAAIMTKYGFYSGSAALVGCIGGFLGGTYIFPKVVWAAYGIMYNMVPVRYVFDTPLAVVSLIVALLCSVGTTWFSCRHVLLESAANLMRPKSPKAGKRVFLENILFIWKRLKFLQKVSIRNILRYKKRFFMMVAGISGCTALLVTGFGVKDSVTEIASMQFEEIQIYDMNVNFKDSREEGMTGAVTDTLDNVSESYSYFAEQSVDLQTKDGIKGVNLVVPQQDNVESFLDFHTTQGEQITFPEKGNVIVSHKICELNDISVGDQILLRNEDGKEVKATVSGIFENYIYNYVFMSADTYQGLFGHEPEYKTAYVNLKEEQDVHQAAASLMKWKPVSAVTVNVDTMERFSGMMDSLNYVVLLIITCAAFLAFIVLYNLTNINITERNREIATLKVLGFFRMETASYVFRENIILTVIGTGVGMILGKFFHMFVMSQIKIDMIAFAVKVEPISYLYSALLTMVFACVVNLFMSVKLETINMAESLKTVD